MVAGGQSGWGDVTGTVAITDGTLDATAINLAYTTGAASGASGTTSAKFERNGGVSSNDFDLLAGGFSQSLTGLHAAFGYHGLLAFAAAHDDLVAFEAVTGVPEPTSLGLIAARVTLALRHRR